ncbi:MAG: hypothetical protein H7146_03010, partial [Burkholderiaceae bacterium]|nr:hypothetical protein [Microbacteriaceae bacterium]
RVSTGFPLSVRVTVMARSNGVCEVCNVRRGDQIHHRRPRGMGGTSRASSNTAANALHLCAECHGEIESFRDVGAEMGHIVGQNSDPAGCPVYLALWGWVLLDEDGGIMPSLWRAGA